VQGTRAKATFPFRNFFFSRISIERKCSRCLRLRKKWADHCGGERLVARLENLDYVMRSVARDDRRKVMVCITPKGSALVRRIREEMVGNLVKY